VAVSVIILENLKVRAFIGVTERERSRRQKLLVSVEMECGPPPGGPPPGGPPDAAAGGDGAEDSIENTVDYSLVRRAVKELLEGSRFKLIETAAARVARALKARFGPKATGRIRVTVKKFPYRDAAYAAYRCDLPP
jgi:dihydroneopterin aldolase